MKSLSITKPRFTHASATTPRTLVGKIEDRVLIALQTPDASETPEVRTQPKVREPFHPSYDFNSSPEGYNGKAETKAHALSSPLYERLLDQIYP